MQTQDRVFATLADALLANIRDLLDSSDPASRVRAIHYLAVGVDALERRVLLDALASG